MKSSLCRLLTALATLAMPLSFCYGQSLPNADSPRYVMAHYMPWYAADPEQNRWGWHWTMDHFNPSQINSDRRQIASAYYPIIGPYDSGDRDVLEYHCLLMKLSGIDGVIIDWYGRDNVRDYPLLHRNTTRMIEQTERLGMKFIICYEDQTIPVLEQAGRITADERVSKARSEVEWLGKYWFKSGSCVKLAGEPVLLSFGHAGLTSAEWTECLNGIEQPPVYFSEHDRRPVAQGAFDWPIPQAGLVAVDKFYRNAENWPAFIPVAFPRFVDIYKQAGVNDGYGRIEDRGGRTFRQTAQQAFASSAAIIQIATWNDWGEGTNIEPSREFGDRDLIQLQSLRRKFIDPTFIARDHDLKLPLRILNLRRSTDDPALNQQLDDLAQKIAAGSWSGIARQLDGLENSL